MHNPRKNSAELLRNLIFITLSVCLFLCAFTGCKQKKSPSQMSDEEKLNYQLDDSLTADEKNQQLEARQKILDRIHQTQAGDKALEDAMNNARELLTNSQYQALEASQQLWLRQGRGKDIQALTQSGIPAAEAFSKAAEDRSDWITERTTWAMLLDMPGKFGGLYHSPDDRVLALYEMPDNHLNMIFRVLGHKFYFTGLGTYDDESALMHTEEDDTIILKILKKEDNKLMMVATEAFERTKFASSATLLEGVYERYQPGEIDVFAP